MEQNKNTKVIDTLNKLNSSIELYKKKIAISKKYSIYSFIIAGIFLICFIILTSLYFTIIHNNLLMVLSIVSLVLLFISLQFAIVNIVLIKYLYKVKLNNLVDVLNTINKSIK